MRRLLFTAVDSDVVAADHDVVVAIVVVTAIVIANNTATGMKVDH